MYYLNSRYYDAKTGRFINPDTVDVLTVSAKSLTDKNLYAYCDNNPVVRKDTGGDFWETAADVISLGASIVEVSANPADPLAWAALVGDVVDLTPFLTGTGEIVKAIGIHQKAVAAGDDVIKAAKKVDIPKQIRDGFGSYEINFASGNNYVGKGNLNRAITSATRKSEKYNDKVTSIRWKSSFDERQSFIDEYYMQKRSGGRRRDGARTYNEIWSPGKKHWRVP